MKPFGFSSILLLIVVLALLVGGLFTLVSSSAISTLIKQNSSLDLETKNTNSLISSSENQSYDTYENYTFGYEITYPENLIVSDNERLDGSNLGQYHYVKLTGCSDKQKALDMCSSQFDEYLQIETHINSDIDELENIYQDALADCHSKDPRSLVEYTDIDGFKAVKIAYPVDEKAIANYCNEKYREVAYHYSENYALLKDNNLIWIYLNTNNSSETSPTLLNILKTFNFK